MSNKGTVAMDYSWQVLMENLANVAGGAATATAAASGNKTILKGKEMFTGT